MKNNYCMHCGSGKLQSTGVSFEYKPNIMYTGAFNGKGEEAIFITRRYTCIDCYANIQVTYQGSKEESLYD
jgi:hypothetical protein